MQVIIWIRSSNVASYQEIVLKLIRMVCVQNVRMDFIWTVIINVKIYLKTVFKLILMINVLNAKMDITLIKTVDVFNIHLIVSM
jgi:hypothetical protein